MPSKNHTPSKVRQLNRGRSASSRSPSRRTASRPSSVVVGVVIVAAIIAGIIFATTRRGTDVAAAAPSIAHVHGLGVNPTGGDLYVATHTGTFRLPDNGAVRRVGRSAQDTMGFTVVGPDRFLGSGHPDAAGFRQGKPTRLGLIESTDAGATWTSRSLSGEVDFHALAASQGTTYGWDSGTSRLLASTDNRSWETRSTLQLSGLAVDPAGADRLVVAAPAGPLASTDGGRSWQPISGAPLLASLSWAPGGTLWGVDRTGGTHSSTDAGGTWQPAGILDGKPEAVLATDDRVIAAVAGPDDRTAIYQSTDTGRTWQLRYRNQQ